MRSSCFSSIPPGRSAAEFARERVLALIRTMPNGPLPSVRMPPRPRPARRLALAFLAATLVVAACGDGGADRAADAGSTTTVVSGGPSDTTIAGTPTTDLPGAGPSPSTDSSGAPTSAVPDGGGPAPTTTSAAAVPAPGAVGGYAAFYLRPSESARIVLDVHSQAGAEPMAATIDHVGGLLADVSGKQVQRNGGTVAGGGQAWTAGDIRALADRTGLPQSRDRSVLKLFFLRGEYAESDTVLGVAVRSDVAAVFSDKVDEATGVLDSPGRIEVAVTTHEVGHLLGLVDLVLSTGRQDPQHPGHSPNQESVMYWAVESTLVGSLLEGGPPTAFDAADRADLATIRNG